MAEPTDPSTTLLARPAVAAVIVVVAALLAYQNSFSGAFTLDDFDAIKENASIRQLWPLWPALSPPSEAGVGGRPFANLTFALNYAMSGTEVWSYHAVNLLIHASAALALLGVVRRTLLLPRLREQVGAGAAPLALASAVLWVVHPLQTAAVDYLSQRTEVLMSLCYLLTLYGFIRGVEGGAKGWGVFAVVACTLGMASKEVMVTAPLMVFIYDRAFVAGSWREAWRARHGVHLALAATWLVLAYLMISSPLTERGVGFGRGVTTLEYAFTESRAVLVYLGLAVWPGSLVFDHGWPFLTAREAWPYAIGLGGVLTVVAYAWWRWPRAGFCAAWFLVLLAPSSSVVPIIQQPVAESRPYLALAGLVTLGVYAAFRVVGPRIWLWCGLLAVAGIGLTAMRNLDYVDEVTLWTDTIVKRPKNARAHSNLAAALARLKRIDEAAVHAGAAVKLQPRSYFARTNLGAALLQGGLVRESIPHFEAALRAQPQSLIAHLNLGDALVQLGRFPEAMAHYEQALAINPEQPKVHRNYSVALRLEDRMDDAIAHARSAVRFDPENADGHYNLGSILLQANRVAEAMPYLEKALRLRPNFPDAIRNLEYARKMLR